MTYADEDFGPWRKHDGGEMPVKGDRKVQIEYCEDGRVGQPYLAACLDWRADGIAAISRYRPLKRKGPLRPVVLGVPNNHGDSGTTYLAQRGGDEAIGTALYYFGRPTKSEKLAALQAEIERVKEEG